MIQHSFLESPPHVNIAPVTARYRWTVEDLLIGRKHAHRVRKTWLIFFVTLGVGLFASGFFRGKHVSHGHELTAAMVTTAILLVAILVTLPLGKRINAFFVRREFAKRPDANAEIVWEFTAQGISTSSSAHKSEIQWSVFQRVISTSAGFLFMPNRQIFHFIPARAFATGADIENLKILARRHAADFKELK